LRLRRIVRSGCPDNAALDYLQSAVTGCFGHGAEVGLKISDFILSYAGRHNSHSQSICRVRVFATRSERRFALLTDLGDQNGGPSITNSAEALLMALMRRGYVTRGCEFIQHYEAEGPFDPRFDAVALSSDGEARWDTLSQDEVATMLECPLNELTDNALDNPRLVAEIGRLKHRLYPRQDQPEPDPNSVIRRKLEIEKGMISKAKLAAAIEAGSPERALQSLVRKDLSLLGEVYAEFPGEYICFAEFQLGDGVVDFAVFTGRSRMEVFLIEIKGAGFNLVNGNHYKEFNAKINEAAGQVRGRFRAIHTDYETFRRRLHRIRVQAEKGSQNHRPFLGPDIPLEVDPNKDILVHGVVIGGRMRNDLSESRKRHDFESGRTPPIRIESWDSWVNKLQRI
jgi:hypothetical protein